MQSVMEYVVDHGYYFASSSDQTAEAETRVKYGQLIRLWEAFPEHITNTLEHFYVIPVKSPELLPKVIFDYLAGKVIQFFPIPKKGDLCVVFFDLEAPKDNDFKVIEGYNGIKEYPVLATISDIRESRKTIEICLPNGTCLFVSRDRIKILVSLDIPFQG